MTDDRWHDADERLGRAAGSRPLRLLGWLAVAVWIAVVSWHLAPMVLR